MKTIFFKMTTALCIIFPLATLAQSGPVTNAHPGVGKILVVGDSLAAGYKATDNNVKPAGCLAKYFDHSHLINVAVPGLTSDQILRGVKHVTYQKPKLIFVSSGGNDTLHDNKTPGSYPAQKTFDEMNVMFDDLLKTGAVVVYLGLNPPAPYAVRLPEIWPIAYGKGVIVVDGMDGLWENPLLMSDKYHPNNLGYSIMCDRIVAATRPYYP